MRALAFHVAGAVRRASSGEANAGVPAVVESPSATMVTGDGRDVPDIINRRLE